MPYPVAVTVEASLATGPDATPTWVTLGKTLTAKTYRGRNFELNVASPGTGDFLLDNSDSDYTPLVVSGVSTDKQVRARVTLAGTDYYLHTGTTESWPVRIDGAGFGYGTANPLSTDAFDFLNSVTLRSAYAASVLASTPQAYWPLAEPAGALFSADLAAQGVGSLSLFPATCAFGAGALVPSDTATSMSSLLGTETYPNYAPGYGAYTTNPVITSANYTIETTFSTVGSGNLVSYYLETQAYGPQGHYDVVQVGVGPGGVSFTGKIASYDPNNPATANAFYTTSTPGYADGYAHHLIVTVTGQTVSIYVDGVLRYTQTFAGIFTLDTTPFAKPGRWYVGGDINGQIGQVALYNRALTATEVTTHSNAWKGFPGETAGPRITRMLTQAGWTQPTNIETGTSQLNPQQTTGMNALQAIQQAASYDQGVFFVDGQGRPTFHGRRHRTNQASRFTLGSATVPITDRALTIGYDRQHLENDITATRANGGSVRVVDAGSVATHRTRASQVTLDVSTDAELRDAANWRLSRYSQPLPRIPQVTLDPFTSSGSRIVALTVEVGDRVTVTGLPSNAPATTLDFYVESVAHEMTDSSWLTVLQLSPADGTYWVLDTSLLDSGTVLAY